MTGCWPRYSLRAGSWGLRGTGHRAHAFCLFVGYTVRHYICSEGEVLLYLIKARDQSASTLCDSETRQLFTALHCKALIIS